MTHKDVLDRLEVQKAKLWRELPAEGRWLRVRCLWALRRDVALEEAEARRAVR